MSHRLALAALPASCFRGAELKAGIAKLQEGAAQVYKRNGNIVYKAVPKNPLAGGLAKVRCREERGALSKQP